MILSHTLCRGISIIPETNNPSRIAENWDVIFPMEADDFNVIDNLMGMRGDTEVLK